MTIDLYDISAEQRTIMDPFDLLAASGQRCSLWRAHGPDRLQKRVRGVVHAVLAALAGPAVLDATRQAQHTAATCARDSTPRNVIWAQFGTDPARFVN